MAVASFVAVRIAVQRVERRELCAVGGHVDELVPPGHVTRGIDRRITGTQVFVDPDAAVLFEGHLDVGKAEPLGVGRAPGRRQHDLRPERFLGTVQSDIEGDAAAGAADPSIGQAGADGDALLAKIAGEGRADLRLALGQEAAPANQRHPDAGAREQLGELAADIAAADHQHGARQLLEL